MRLSDRSEWAWGAAAGLALAAVVAFAVLALFSHSWVRSWRASTRLGDPAWWENASHTELRQTAEEALASPLGNAHDACLLLKYLGDDDSVVHLVRALQWMDETEGEMPCPKAHCLETLVEITGHYAGENLADWHTWLEASAARSRQIPTETAGTGRDWQLPGALEDGRRCDGDWGVRQFSE